VAISRLLSLVAVIGWFFLPQRTELVVPLPSCQ
jgi:hypothetical protein